MMTPLRSPMVRTPVGLGILFRLPTRLRWKLGSWDSLQRLMTHQRTTTMMTSWHPRTKKTQFPWLA